MEKRLYSWLLKGDVMQDGHVNGFNTEGNTLL